MEQNQGENVESDGPYKATTLWREAVRSFREGMVQQRHWRHLRCHERCFTGQAAAVWLQRHLSAHPLFSAAVSRDQTVRLLDKFLQAGIMVEVRPRRGRQPQFRDDSRLYRLSTHGTPGRSAVALCGGTAEPPPSPAASPELRRPALQPLQQQHQQQQQLPQCRPVMRALSAAEVNTIWSNALLARLECVLECPVSDLVPPSCVVPAWIRHNTERLTPSGLVQPLPDSDPSLPRWLVLAMKTLANWPEVQLTDLPESDYGDFQVDVFRTICQYFRGLPFALVPADLYDPLVSAFLRAERAGGLPGSAESLLLAAPESSSTPRPEEAGSWPPPPAAVTPAGQSVARLRGRLARLGVTAAAAPRLPSPDRDDVFEPAPRPRADSFLRAIADGKENVRPAAGRCVQAPTSLSTASLPSAGFLPSCSTLPPSNTSLPPSNTSLRPSSSSLRPSSSSLPWLDQWSGGEQPSLGSAADSSGGSAWWSDSAVGSSLVSDGSCLETVFGAAGPVTRLIPQRSVEALHLPAVAAADGEEEGEAAWRGGARRLRERRRRQRPPTADYATFCGGLSGRPQSESGWQRRSVADPSRVTAGSALSPLQQTARQRLSVVGRDYVNVRTLSDPSSTAVYQGRFRATPSKRRLSPPPAPSHMHSGHGLMTARSHRMALEGLQLLLLLLPPDRRRRLQLLIRFMHKVAANRRLELTDHTAGAARHLVVSTFAECVLSAPCGRPLDSALVRRLVTYLVEHQAEILAPSEHVRHAVTERLRQRRREKVQYEPDDGSQSGGGFCERVSTEQYQQEGAARTSDSLLSLLDLIICDTTMSRRDKTKRLRQFREVYPEVYARRVAEADRELAAAAGLRRTRPLLSTGSLSSLIRSKSLRI